MNNDTQAQKLLILKAALSLVPTEGWSEELLEKASIQAGFKNNYGKLIFIGGIKELIDLYFSYIDSLMLEHLNLLNTKALGVSAKIRLALKTRIKVLSLYKAVTAKTVSFLSLPWNMALGLKLGWRTVDLIWDEIVGDDSNDFNYYTKRGLLYATYIASIQFFLSDHSKNHHETDEFIDRRIDEVLSLGKFISKFS
jgi:ubiquinone biosynthesis protein COQ9